MFSGTSCTGRRGARRSCSRPGCRPSSAASPRCPSGSARGEPAGAAGAAGRLADRARRGRRRRRVPAARALLAGLPFSDARDLRDRAARRQRARGAAADDHARARGRRPRAGPPRRAGQAAERGRDARLDDRDLHRQDRHADREPDAAVSSGPRGEVDSRQASRHDRGRSLRRSRPRSPRAAPPTAGDRTSRGRRPDRGGAARRRAARSAPTPAGRRASAGAGRSFHFDPALQADDDGRRPDGGLVRHTKGAPESVLERCARRSTAAARRGR